MGVQRPNHEPASAPLTLAHHEDPAHASALPPLPDAEARAEMLARAGHALKAPLAVIKGSATTLLASQWDTATQQELLALIDAQTDILLRQLNSLLDVWRLEGRQDALHLAPTRIAPLLDELAARWARAPSARAVRLSAQADLPPVALDAAWIAQALDRVVDFTARQMAPAAPAMLTIEARAGEGMLTLAVLAPGVALPAERLARLFEPQGAGAEAGADGDLALVRAVARAHGGTVSADMLEDGDGLRVELVLPLEPARAAAPHEGNSSIMTAESSASGPRDPRDRRVRPVVIVAERDTRLARLIRASLEEHGYRAVLADDARRLARLADQEDPDLILLDSRLDARLSGAGGALASVFRGPGSAPVIVLGAGAEDDCVRALDLGAHDYLGKPFGLGEMLARVRAALRASIQGQQPVPEPLFRSGDLEIDFAQRQVRMGERTVPLSRTEFNLLRELARHAGRVLTHEQLLERVWGSGYGQEVEFLWVYVRRLRRKLEPDPRHPCYILTVPGVGYRLAQR